MEWLRSPWTVGFGLVVGAAGAILAFGFERDSPDELGTVDLEAVGVIVLALGAVVLMLGFAAGYEGWGAGSGDPRLTTGLVAVAVAIGAVVALTLVTITIVDVESDTAVPLATAAFGVISAVAGAYLGIKVTAAQGERTAEEADVLRQQLGAARNELRITGLDEARLGAALQRVDEAGASAAADATARTRRTSGV